jgi:uncharacterized membrane protein
MQTLQFRFIVKVLVASALISVGIKTVGPQLNLSATSDLVLAMVLLPSTVMGLALGIQYQLKRR